MSESSGHRPVCDIPEWSLWTRVKFLNTTPRKDPVTINIYGRLNDLPHFNPDIEFDGLEAVTDLKAQVAAADGLILSCPEYAHGVPGSFKNALDWLVGGPEFYAKPVAFFFNASDRGVHAQAALREIVKTMSGIIVEEACVTVPLLGKHLRTADIQKDPELSTSIQSAIAAFATWLDQQQTADS